MASKAFLMTIMVAAAVAPAIAMDYMVGDSDGWKLGVNYTQWAAGKSFHVGDSMMFMYNAALHNVIQVSGPDFKNCTNSGALGGPYNSGNDTIALNTPGRRWYICGTAGHCDGGMKFVISVTAPGPAPAPAPWSQAPAAPAVGSLVWMAATIAAAFLMIMA